MLPIEVRRARSARERATFVKMAWQFYREDPHWVAPLVADSLSFIDPARGPFFEHGKAELFLAYRGARPVGRISAHWSPRYDAQFPGATGFVGFFECEDDRATAKALFDAAEAWLRGQGRRRAEGPMSFGVYDELGVLVAGFDTDPYVLTSHNPAWYPSLFEANGWEKSVDWHAFRARASVFREKLDPRYVTLAQRVLRRDGIVVRPMDPRRHLDRDAAIVQEIFASAWSRNWGHVPVTDREWGRLKEGVKAFLAEDLSFIVELHGKPVAFALTVYDANVAVKKVNGRLFPFGFLVLLAGMKRTRRFRLVLMGVREEHRRQGIELALYARVIEAGLSRGVEELEASQIVETNDAMISSIERMPVDRPRTWRIYRKDLDA